jgi:hypothetical protein
MVVNFRAHGISRDARKLARTPTLNYIYTIYIYIYINTVNDNDDQVINTVNDSMTTFLAPLLATIFLS